jgi:AraC-like DNA-binding protein
MESISAIGIFTSLVFAFLLINKKPKTYSDQVLILWMFLFAIHLVLPFMMAIGNQFFIQKINGLDIGFYTLHFTFLFYYAYSQMSIYKKFNIIHLLWLLPTIIVYVIQGFLDRNADLFHDMISRYFFGDNKIFHLTGVVILNLLFCSYFFTKLLQAYHNHKKNIKENFSYSEKVDLKWIRNLNYTALILTLFIFGYLIALVRGQLNEEWINNIYFSSFSVFAVVLGYWGYKQGRILIYVQAEEIEKNNQINDVSLSPESVLPDIDDPDDPVVTKLLMYMNNEKPWLDPELNIGILANQLDLHSHNLSRLINSHFHQNFYEFVNKYRIDEFKRLAADPKNKHYSLLGLALDSGFNSKASFNRIFKNYTGQTPSQFRNNFQY